MDVIIIIINIIITNIKLTNGAACTYNADYYRYATSPETLYIYEASNSTIPAEIMKNNVTYYQCSWKGGEARYKFRFGIMTSTRTVFETYKTMKCDMNGDGIFLPSDCDFSDTYKLNLFNVVLKPFEFFFVQCGEPLAENELGHIYQVAVKGYDQYKISIVPIIEYTSKLIQVFPGDVIVCTALCMEKQIHFAMFSNNSDITECGENKCQVKKSIKGKRSNEFVVKIQCRDISVNIQPIYDFKVKLGGYEHKRSIMKFDAGEKITCVSELEWPTDPNIVRLKPVEISLGVYWIKYKKGRTYVNERTNQFVIPDMARSWYYYHCYLGNRSDERSRYDAKTGTLSIISHYRTYLYDEITNKPYKFNNPLYIEESAIVSCTYNRYFYYFATPYQFYARDFYYPRGKIRYYPGVILPQFKISRTTVVKSSKIPNMQHFIVCLFNDWEKRTAPIRLITSTQPLMNWIYINPPYETKYHLRQFIIGCKGTNIRDLRVLCVTNCQVGISLQIDTVTNELVTVMIDGHSQMNKRVTIACNGTTLFNKYITLLKELDIRVFHYTGLGIENQIVSIGDKVICKAIFYKRLGSPITISMPIVTRLLIDNIERSSYNGIPIDTTYSVDKLVEYNYCCLKHRYDITKDFDFAQYFCTHWKPLYVARNFYVQYTPDINSVFCGDTIRCHICVNYTHQYNRMCYGKHRIKSFIRLITQDPLGLITDTGEVENITIPCPTFKPGSRIKYIIDEYFFQIGCKVKHSIKMDSLFVRSCESNPPPVFIVPNEKSMFTVGELLSCATKSVRCRSKLKYIIYVRRGSEDIKYEDSKTFELTLQQIGTNVNVKCAPGLSQLATDTRFIRVETPPYNITISPRPRYAFYGDFITCIALGFPKPRIEWIQDKGRTKLRISEGIILIGPWDFSGDYMFTCESRNSRGILKSNISFTIYNRRIHNTHYNGFYQSLLILFLICYEILLVINLVYIHQESFFDHPFFSNQVVRVKGFEPYSKMHKKKKKHTNKIFKISSRK